MQHLTIEAVPSPNPLPPVRVLVEDPLVDLDLCDTSFPGCLELTACTGPASETEECPLVMDGRCPLGAFDVVVGALEGSWARSVRAAWAETGVPYTMSIPAHDATPDERLTHHVAGALATLWASAAGRVGESSL